MIVQIFNFKISLLITLFLSAISLPQDYISEFDGIPLLTYSPHDMGAYQYDYIKAMGIDVVIASNVTTERLLEIKARGLKVIPVQADTTVYEPNYNDIIKYTDARYSIWEAEGTNPDDGDATLTSNNIIGEPYYIENKRAGIVTKKNAKEGVLITGPGYRQEAHYRGIHLSKLIKYQATFKIKVELIYERKNVNPADVVCVFQISNSKIMWSRIIDKTIIKEKALTFGDLLPTKWHEINLEYDLSVLNPPKAESEFFPSAGWAEFVDFSIIWNGNPNFRLYVDKITISDERGREITNPNYHKRIEDQDKKSFATSIDDVVVGWYPIDEPESIDNYEPIRLVDSILNKISNGKRKLWISFPSAWNGRYGDSNLGAEPFFKWREFLKRVKIARLQNNHTIFDYPLTDAENPLGGDFRTKNIELFTESVLSVIQIDSLFSLCLQGGRYDGARLFKDPSPKEILYTANLGLLYGAKSLSIYRYFGENNNLSHSGLVNYTTKDGYIFTDKYYLFKDVLSPRLKGDFGKTIKRLRQVQQFPGLDLRANAHINLNIIKMIEPINFNSNDTSIVELGFFKDWNDSESLFFMMVNRYYSSASNFRFTLQQLKPNTNYEITDFIDNSVKKIFTDKNGIKSFEDMISAGDARLYKIKPL